MDQRAGDTGQAEDSGDRELEARVGGPAATFDLLGDGHSLVDVGQCLVVARLEAKLAALRAQLRHGLDPEGVLLEPDLEQSMYRVLERLMVVNGAVEWTMPRDEGHAFLSLGRAPGHRRRRGTRAARAGGRWPAGR